MAGTGFLEEAREFSLLYSIHAGSWAQPVSYAMSTGDSFPGIMQPGSEADHSHPPSAEVKNGGAISPFPHISSWHSE
jgi:hypothetical protein